MGRSTAGSSVMLKTEAGEGGRGAPGPAAAAAAGGATMSQLAARAIAGRAAPPSVESGREMSALAAMQVPAGASVAGDEDWCLEYSSNARFWPITRAVNEQATLR